MTRKKEGKGGGGKKGRGKEPGEHCPVEPLSWKKRRKRNLFRGNGLFRTYEIFLGKLGWFYARNCVFGARFSSDRGRTWMKGGGFLLSFSVHRFDLYFLFFYLIY